MRYIFYFLVFLFIVIMSLLIHHEKKLNKRCDYETLLIKKFNKANFRDYRGKNEELKPDRPDLAFFQNYIMTFDPKTGEVPSYRLKKAFIRMKELERQKNSFADGIYLEWEELPSDMGGRTRALAVDPTSPDGKKVWAGSVTGGLWYNEDITSVLSPWKPVNDFMDNLSISCIVFDPLDPDVIYAGTGESQTATKMYRESSGLGSGIMKSTDGGLTWNWTSRRFSYISDMIIRMENGVSVIYAAAVSGSYMGEAHLSRPTDGLYRSDNGGTDWEQVLPNIPGAKDPYAPSDIELGADGRLYVGTQRNIENKGAAVILSSDDGRTWDTFTDIQMEIDTVSDPERNIPGRVILSASPSDSNIVYAVVASGGLSPEGFIKDVAWAILKSDDRGITWARTNMPAADGSWAYLAWHALIIKVDPLNPDVVYAGGLDVHKSLDGGNTWHRISDWRGMYQGYDNVSYIHADQHKIVFLNDSSDKMIFSTDGGVFYSADGSAEYPAVAERNMSYNTLQFYSCAAHPAAGKNFYIAGAQDNGTMRYKSDPVTNNDMMSGGDGAYCFTDRDEPNTFITSVYYNRYYVYKTDINDESYLYGSISDYYSGIFINPADFDDRLNILYANATTFTLQYQDQLLVIKDATSAPDGEFVSLSSGSSVPFSHIRVSEFSPDSTTTLFVGTQAGRLFKIMDAENSGATEEIGGLDFPTANISCVDPGRSENEILVSFSNYGVKSVWETKDGGETWSSVEGDLPDMPVRWVMYHPSFPRKAIIATELGIWVTEDLDAQPVHWKPANNGLANVRVDMFKYRESDQTFVAATHGRGLYVTRSTGTFNQASEKDASLDFMIYPNPNNGNFRLDLKQIEAKDVSINSIDGKLVFRKDLKDKYGTENLQIHLNGITPGTYIIQVGTGRRSYRNKFIVK